LEAADMDRSHGCRNFGVTLLLGLGIVAAGFWGCGQKPTEPGMGAVAVHMAFQGTFGQNDETNALPGSGVGSRDNLAILGDGLIPPKRTPLSDLIITFDSVKAWACGLEADEDTTEDAVGFNVLSTLDEDDDCDAYPVLADTSVTVSVAGLDTTLTKLLGSISLPEGDYSRIVLSIAEAWVVTQTEDTLEAHLPGNSDRLKVNSPFTVTDSTVTDVVIVFDVHRSIVEHPPGSMNFKIKPVLHHNQGWVKD
jgi:hypothetical protein